MNQKVINKTKQSNNKFTIPLPLNETSMDDYCNFFEGGYFF